MLLLRKLGHGIVFEIFNSELNLKTSKGGTPVLYVVSIYALDKVPVTDKIQRP